MSDAPTKPRLLLIDGHSLAYRAFYALPLENFSTSTGQPTNAVYGFTSMLINTLRDEKPTHVAVAFDVSRRTFRSERFAEYKANRTKSPEGFSGQVDLIKQVLAALGITSLEQDGYEADDLIATLAYRYDGEVLVLTGDRDALQLVSPHLTVLYPKRGVSELERLDPDAVSAKYGLTPVQYPDFAALRGDPSDNLPNIPGVGEKTAAKWIREYGDLANLLANVDQVSGKVGQALRDHVEQVRVNRELTELVRDVPLKTEVEELRLPPIDRERVHEVFDALQFRVLRDRLFDYLSENVAGVGSDSDFDSDYESLTEPGQLRDWLARHCARSASAESAATAATTADADAGATAVQPTAVAVDGTWGRGQGQVWALALRAPDGAVGWFGATAMADTDEAAFASWLADPSTPKAFLSAKGPMLAFSARGWTLAGLAADAEVAAYVLLPGQRSFELGELVAAFLGKALPGGESESGQLSLAGVDEDADRSRLAAAAVAIQELTAELGRQAGQRNASKLLAEVELPLVDLLARMETAGICVDLPYLVELEREYAAEIAAAEANSHALVGRSFNLGSPKQLQEILFEERRLPKTKKIKTGYTTDADALTWLASISDDPLPAVLLRWRDVTKLRQTVAGLLPLADSESRIHTTLQQTTTATGRLSSADPNLQNIPVRTQEGRRIRQGFVVGTGYADLLTADYNQIEMRIMAHLSEDAGLIEAFRSGEDLHTTVAAQVFGVAPEAVDPEQRRRIKAMSYGLAYGLSAFGLSQQLGVSTEVARKLMDEYFLRFGGVRDYLEEVVQRARATGYTETILGRRRYLPDLNSDNRQRREMAERMALNAPIQGSAADIVKVAMLRVDAALRGAQLKTRLLLQLHDELILEVGPGEREAAVHLVTTEMAAAISLAVPLNVSTGLGRTWYQAAH